MTKAHRYFILTSGAILGITAMAKLVSIFSKAPLMLLPDPLVGLSFRYLLLLAGLAELAVAYLCFFTRSAKRNVLLIAWLSTTFLSYRAGLWFIHWHRPCHCLGDLTEMLHISPGMADNLMKFVLLYLLVGSYASLFWMWIQSQPRPEESGPSHWRDPDHLVESI